MPIGGMAQALAIRQGFFRLYCYVNHHVSIGYCAEIAGMSIEDFMIFLGEHKVSVFNYAEDEIQEDFDNA